MKIENCELVEFGLYKSTDVINHMGIILEIKGRNRWAIDFDLPKKHKQVDLSALLDNGSVTRR